MGKYKTILADPPWDIQQKGGRGASNHYPLMPIADIKALPVKRIAADDAPGCPEAAATGTIA
jgi:hypothetical protein